MKRLIPFVEGYGDVRAVPILLRRLFTHHALWETIGLDPAAFKVGGLPGLCANGSANWKRLLSAALKRPQTGGVILILDGDVRPATGGQFCPANAARALVDEARAVGAGERFSLAVVFACREYESWLLAGVESLAGRRMSDNRVGVRSGTVNFDKDLEVAPRDAKGELAKLMQFGYKETLDQAELTELVDLDIVRKRALRSFARLESALQQLASAFRTGKHVATPSQQLK